MIEPNDEITGTDNNKNEVNMAASTIKIKKICEWCGREFYAQKVTTRFCCKKCNEKSYKAGLRRAQIAKVAETINGKTIPPEGKEYLSVREAAALLGLTRMTVYNLIYRGQLCASKITSRLTVIRKADIESMLSSHSYSKVPKQSSQPITEFYSTKEIKEKYGVSESWIFKVGKEKDIPKIFRMGKTLWSKSHIDKFITKNKPDGSITEWYSVPDLMEKFNMTTSAVYTFVSAHSIPKKKVKREVFYSKAHVDIAKGLVEPEKPQYYTMKEAMEKFGMTRDQLYHYVKVFGIPKHMEGKYVKFSRKEMDAAFSSPKL